LELEKKTTQFPHYRSKRIIEAESRTMASPSPPEEEQVEDDGFLVEARDLSILEGSAVAHSRQTRATLSASDLEKCHKAAVVPLTTHFGLMDRNDGVGGMALSTICDLSARVLSLKTRLREFDMDSSFMIFTNFNSTTKRIIGDGSPIDLLGPDMQDISIEQICKSNTFLRLFGKGVYHQQNLIWSQELIRGSTESAGGLLDRINERMDTFKPSEGGGPLYFKLLMDAMTTMTDEAAAALVVTIRTFTLKNDDVPGENIETTVQYLRAAIFRLQSSKSLPKDYITILIDVFASASSDVFRSHFETLRSLKFAGLQADITAESIFTSAISLYKTLQSQSKWCSTGRNANPKQSSFYGGKEETRTCYNCGVKGHTSPDCPNKKGSNGNGGTPSTPGGNKVANQMGNRRTPPAEGGSETRVGKKPDGTDRQEFWCGKCKMWNMNHITSAHINREELAAKRAAELAAAALLATTPAEGTTGSPGAVGAVADTSDPTSSMVMVGGVATHTAAANLLTLLNPNLPSP
jgi:hypothetical protein